MIKKLVRHGNSRALVIDKPILDLLNISDDTEIEIVTDGTSLTMRPVRSDADRRHAFETARGDQPLVGRRPEAALRVDDGHRLPH
ncbi:MAG TPA: AbrB/MazE/SpoVT family DNA-binding domain-containing protein [Coriobacteriia bacterium]